MLHVISYLVQILSGASLIALGAYVYFRRRGTSGYFALMVSLLGSWAILYAIPAWLVWRRGSFAFPVPLLESLRGSITVLVGLAVFYFGYFFSEPAKGKIFHILRNGFTVLAIPAVLLPWSEAWFSDRRLMDGEYTLAFGPLYYVTSFYTILGGLLSYGMLFRKYSRSENPGNRNHLLYTLVAVGTGFSLMFVFSFFLPVLGWQDVYFVGPFAATAVTFIFARGIVSEQLFDIRPVIHRTIFWFLSTVLFIALAYSALTAYLLNVGEVSREELVALVAFFVGLSFWHVRFVQPRLDAAFLKGVLPVEDIVYQFVRALSRLGQAGLEQATARVLELFVRLFNLERAVAVIAWPGGAVRPVSTVSETEPDGLLKGPVFRHPGLWGRLYDGDRPIRSWFSDSIIQTNVPRFSRNDLRRRYPRIYRELSATLKRLEAAGLDMCIPVVHEGAGIGLIFLGRKKNQKPYFESDLRLLRTLEQALSIGLWNVFNFQRLQTKSDKLRQENKSLVAISEQLVRNRSRIVRNRRLVYRSEAMQKVMELAEMCARTPTTVLLLGESGTGKELLASFIHQQGVRGKGRFVALNCAAVPEALLEDELFGHEKGAFTGAGDRRRGRFEESEGGTLFLDEIGDLPFHLQSKLLRVIQEREFQRLGGGSTIRWKGRLILATHRNLENMVEAGEFRKDLFYRINVVSIKAPPLRERKEDIFPLLDLFLKKYAAETGKPTPRITEGASNLMLGHDWPGNVRELENVVCRAVIVCKEGRITEEDLSDSVRSPREAVRERNPGADETALGYSFDEIIRDHETRLLRSALDASGGNQTEAARILKISRRKLGYKLKQYEIG